MAKYGVTHSCGHKQTHQLFGKHKDRERKLEWLATTLCSECYQAKLIEDRDESTKRCHEWAREEGLPVLLGTERQIAWAESLRACMLNKARTAAEGIGERVQQHPAADTPEVKTAVAALLDALTWLSMQDHAKFWIDNRNTQTVSPLDIFGAMLGGRPRECSGLELLLLCPYVEPHLVTLLGERYAKMRAEEIAERAAAAAKQSEEAAKKVRLDERREADRTRLIALTGDADAQLAVKTDNAKKRVYIGGYPALVTYYVTGDRYHAAGSLECKTGVVADVATRLGVSESEALEQLTQFCHSLASYWTNLRIN
jgi:hypothetical protein